MVVEAADYLSVVDSSRALPTGVVTFLLTDIQGSTRLWETVPDAMRQALVRHDAIVAACVRRQNGHVVKSKGEGDSVFAVFRHARDAVNAALILQCALGVERWATPVPIRVRMAIHTGPIDLRDGDYYGPTVNRCARLRALGKGGQVLISGATAQLIKAQLPSGASLDDLGSHPLKDLSAPERVWQLVHPQMTRALAQAEPERHSAATSESSTVCTAYKLTDHANADADGRAWGEGTTHTDEQGMSCYTSPLVAALFNPLRERFRLPRLWEARIDVDPDRASGLGMCKKMTTRRQVPLPTLSAQDHARFAVLCARTALEGSTLEAEFGEWADTFLGGLDSSGVAARAIADALESEAHDSTGAANSETLLAANAARAAMHAARTAWMAGRARDEENSAALELAGEAVREAARIGHLDLTELADRALPRLATPSAARLRPAAA